MFNVSTIGHTTHIKPIVQFLPNASQHCIVNGCNGFCYLCIQLIQIPFNAIYPDLTPRDFFLWEFVKRLVSIPRKVDEPNTQITEAVATTDNAMLGRVWQELDYRLDVCRVTNGAHIEHLSTFHVKTEITRFLNLADAFLYS